MSIFSDNVIVREVWADNLEEEMLKIREIGQCFPYVGLDTEFRREKALKIAQGDRKFNYPELKVDVNRLNLIKLGFTFFDKDGNLPTCGTDHFCVWQFNFPRNDGPSKDSIDVEEKNEEGINAATFCDQLKSYGVIWDKNRRWVTFNGRYDFGFLIKILNGENLPETLQEFSEKLKEFSPVVYDIKHVMQYPFHIINLAEDLGVKRFGNNQQAGTGSLLKSRIFVKLKELHSEKRFEDHAGVLFSLADS